MKRVWGLALLVLVGIVAGANPAFAQVEGFSFTKAFGAASIPLNGTTSLTFNLKAIPNPLVDSFTDTLPAGLLVATPNGLSAVTGCGLGTVTATAGSSVVSLTAAVFGSCSFSVNVTGTTVGVKNNSVTDSLDLETATASLTVTAATELQDYFSNANTTGGQGFVNITAPFEGNETASSPVAQEGEICAMIYVLNTDQALQACCGCPVTADGLLTLSISGNLAPNPLASGKILHDGSIRILSTAINAAVTGLEEPRGVNCDTVTGACCDPTADHGSEPLVPQLELAAWANHVQNTQITEAEFQTTPAAEAAGDLTNLPSLCAFAVEAGSGQGVCTCGTGGFGIE